MMYRYLSVVIFILTTMLCYHTDDSDGFSFLSTITMSSSSSGEKKKEKTLATLKNVVSCNKLFGEWSIRFSDDPRIPGKSASLGIIQDTGMNRVLIRIRPGGVLEVYYPFYRGLFLTEISQKCRYRVRDRIHSRMTIEVSFGDSRETIISFCGLEIDDLRPVLNSQNIEKERILLLDVEIVRNDLFIIAQDKEDSSNSSFYYHLVRMDTMNQPSVAVSMSNLIFTNILTMFLTHFLHDIVHLPG